MTVTFRPVDKTRRVPRGVNKIHRADSRWYRPLFHPILNHQSLFQVCKPSVYSFRELGRSSGNWRHVRWPSSPYHYPLVLGLTAEWTARGSASSHRFNGTSTWMWLCHRLRAFDWFHSRAPPSNSSYTDTDGGNVPEKNDRCLSYVVAYGQFPLVSIRCQILYPVEWERRLERKEKEKEFFLSFLFREEIDGYRCK